MKQVEGSGTTEKKPLSRLGSAVSLRQLAVSDAAAMAEMLTRNRVDIGRVGWPKPAEFFTPEVQALEIERLLSEQERGARYLWTICVAGELAGDVSLSHVQRGPLQRANVGYLLDHRFRGRGVASAAVRLVVEQAFTQLGFHSLEAGTLPTNVPSQRVLAAAGFTQIGLARGLLFTDGAWEDYLLYEIIGPDTAPSTPPTDY